MQQESRNNKYKQNINVSHEAIRFKKCNKIAKMG